MRISEELVDMLSRKVEIISYEDVFSALTEIYEVGKLYCCLLDNATI